MTLKHRLKKIEARISPPQKFKNWIAHDEKEVEEITSGKRKHADGTFYNAMDMIYLINRIFTDKKPDEIEARNEPVHSFDFGKNDTTELDQLPRKLEDGQNVDIEARISALEQRKTTLEKKIAEGEK